MAEAGGDGGAAKVRVVRCPKCEKLLPELPNFAIYRCGCCGAALQAKKHAPAKLEAPIADSESEKMSISQLDICKTNPENTGMVVPDVRSLGSNENGDTEKHECLVLSGVSVAGREGRDVSVKCSDSRFENNTSKKECGGVTNGNQFHNTSMNPASNPQLCVDDGDGFEAKIQIEGANGDGDGSNRRNQIRPRSDVVERNRGSALQRALRSRAEAARHTPYPDEGPSNYYPNSRHRDGGGGPIRKHDAGGIEHLEQDRTELLRKLDELRDQLKKSCEISEMPEERPPKIRPISNTAYGLQRSGNWSHEGPSSLNHASAQHSSFPNGPNVDAPSFYPTLCTSNHDVPGYVEPCLSHAYGRAPFHHPIQYPRRPLDNSLYRQFDPDPFISYRHEGLYAQPVCSCVHPYNKHCLIPSQALPTIIGYPPVPVANHHHGASPLTLSAFARNDPRVMDGTAQSREPRPDHRATLNRREARPLRPVAGAAPFVVCFNCFSLLQIPEKLPVSVNSKHKLRCGFCSQVILFDLDGRRLVTSVPTPAFSENSKAKKNSADGVELQFRSRGINNPPLSDSLGSDSPVNGLPSTDDKLVLSSHFSISSDETFERDFSSEFREVEKTLNLSSSSNVSENMDIMDTMNHMHDMSSSTELPVEPEDVPCAPIVPRLGYCQYTSNHVMNGPGKGSRSKRSDHEKALVIDGSFNFKQNSVKDVQVESKMNVSVDEYPNPGLSHDSLEVNDDADQPRAGRGGESFLTGLIKKSFKDFPRFTSTENGNNKISINGHHISDRSVKKAEKQAGEIHSGDYWYDYRAGFWGVMGYPCLGIIPPFIEEFNYPMSKKCAGGNTGVLVNGRELQQKDLDLLAARGLPTMRGKSYVIDISGKVWDEDTGEEIENLGKLAPTVEKVRHGFGMRVP